MFKSSERIVIFFDSNSKEKRCSRIFTKLRILFPESGKHEDDSENHCSCLLLRRTLLFHSALSHFLYLYVFQVGFLFLSLHDTPCVLRKEFSDCFETFCVLFNFFRTIQCNRISIHKHLVMSFIVRSLLFVILFEPFIYDPVRTQCYLSVVGTLRAHVLRENTEFSA